jgi:hypothetical protein
MDIGKGFSLSVIHWVNYIYIYIILKSFLFSETFLLSHLSHIFFRTTHIIFVFYLFKYLIHLSKYLTHLFKYLVHLSKYLIHLSKYLIHLCCLLFSSLICPTHFSYNSCDIYQFLSYDFIFRDSFFPSCYFFTN